MSILKRPMSQQRPVDGNLQAHLAAISPYHNVFKQPDPPLSKDVHAAVYLFRHGILEVSQYDYSAFIAPFLKKLSILQASGDQFVKGRLGFMADYKSWITEAHVGMVSQAGIKQSKELGEAFRIRYSQWLNPQDKCHEKPALTIWTDSADRCQRSATAFADSFSGKGQSALQDIHGLSQVDAKIVPIVAKNDSMNCDNLCWHKSFGVDQTVGHDSMMELMKLTTSNASRRLQDDWIAPDCLEAKDLYAMQLLHCYDIVAERPSPFNDCFQSDDWPGFEYLRDAKYHFSEGYGASRPGFFAIPWLKAAVTALSDPKSCSRPLPLQMGFTHREEVLYLCCLLGINYVENWTPDITRIDTGRKWRASLMAPYLGHIGLEKYLGSDEQYCIRIIVNGSVQPAFYNQLKLDESGGYSLKEVEKWTDDKLHTWQKFSRTAITFIS